MPSPAVPGILFAFAAMVLLIFVSVSPPVWDKVNFLEASNTAYGVFGKCTIGAACTQRSLGYDLTPIGASVGDVNQPTLVRLTGAFILHPIAGAIALAAVIFGILGMACASRFSTVLMALTAAVGAFVALFIFVVDIVIFTITRNTINANGGNAMLGNANWLTLGAVVALFLSFCTSTCGACGRFATGRAAGEKY